MGKLMKNKMAENINSNHFGKMTRYLDWEQWIMSNLHTAPVLQRDGCHVSAPVPGVMKSPPPTVPGQAQWQGIRYTKVPYKSGPYEL